MTHPIPDLALVRRVEAAESSYTLARLQVLERLPGNPVGIAYRRDGDGRVLALRAKYLPIGGFNRVVGMTDAQAGLVPKLAAWFRDAGVRGRFDILPGGETSTVCSNLVAEGYTQSGAPNRYGYAESGFHASLYAAASPPPETAPGDVVVERVETPAAMETFLDAYCDGWGVPHRGRDDFKSNVRGWIAEPGWRLYLAHVHGKSAGTAILYLHEGAGYLADASTAPELRGRGVHLALLVRRWRDAAEAGAELVCAQAAYLSTSHRNMERAGLRLLHTQAIWTAPAL